MYIFEIKVGDWPAIIRDMWHVKATSLVQAVKKAENKRSQSKELYQGWELISVKNLGEFSE